MMIKKLNNQKRPIFKIKLKIDDQVIVRSGKDKGKIAKVTAVHPRQNKVTVDGVNIIKKHLKPNEKYPQGTILEYEKPIWVSKVALYEPNSKKASRVGLKIDQNGLKRRYYKISGKEV